MNTYNHAIAIFQHTCIQNLFVAYIHYVAYMHLYCLQIKNWEKFNTTYNIELTHNAIEHMHDRKDFGHDMIILIQDRKGDSQRIHKQN